MSNSAIEKWRDDLAAWAIPNEILEQAEVAPWIHPPALFQIPETIPNSPSHRRAREALQQGGTILDIGCGGGVAAFAATPPAAHVIGVDHQKEMLEMFQSNALSRGITSEIFEGFWPSIATQVPVADVVTVHHVVYNVGEIAPFVQELNSHARKRVVIELPTVHPMSSWSNGWKHFWKIDRPTSPTSEDFMRVLSELGIPAQKEDFTGEILLDKEVDEAADYTRIRLCLPKERIDEVRDFLDQNPAPTSRSLSVVWWDKV